MKKINLLQIFIHFIATCFFILSFRTFAVLNNLKLFKALNELGTRETLENSTKYGFESSTIWDWIVFISYAGLVGILCAFIISLLLSIRKKWSVVNSFIVVFLSFLIYRFDLNWALIGHYATPGIFVDDLIFRNIVSGIFSLSIGILLFSFRKINKKIENFKVNI